MKRGTKVRMSEEFKTLLRGKCTAGHVGPFLYGAPEHDQPDSGCTACSSAHIDEFGESIGIVEGLVDYNNDGEPYDPTKIGPELNVRWEPDNLRYGYHPKHLVVVEEA